MTITASQKSKRELKKMNKSLEIKLANSTLILSKANDAHTSF